MCELLRASLIRRKKSFEPALVSQRLVGVESRMDRRSGEGRKSPTHCHAPQVDSRDAEGEVHGKVQQRLCERRRAVDREGSDLRWPCLLGVRLLPGEAVSRLLLGHLREGVVDSLLEHRWHLCLRIRVKTS
jgi:hypothetical protein